jgi:hypothetical protein
MIWFTISLRLNYNLSDLIKLSVILGVTPTTLSLTNPIKLTNKNMEIESIHEYKDDEMKFHLMEDGTDDRIHSGGCWMRSEF